MKPAGYSGTPLAAKLGIKPGSIVVVEHAIAGYRKLLAPLPVGVRFSTTVSEAVDIVHVFATRRAELAVRLAQLFATMRHDAAIWVSWPKKASRKNKVAGGLQPAGIVDITEGVIRDIALPLGLVDIKVCAINETWSGLKLVKRKSKR
jgi:hypothetical protein